MQHDDPRWTAMAVLAMVLTTALWGATFVAPLLLPQLAPLAIAGLRYGVFGAGSLVLWLWTRDRGPQDWRRAGLHALTGNIGHYVLAVLAVRVAGAPVTVSVIALVPVAYGILGARQDAREHHLHWRSLAAPLALTGLGIVAVDVATLRGAGAPTVGALVGGILLAAASGGAWLWYGLDTARHLRATGTSASDWTNTVGVATAPLAVPLLVIGFATTLAGGGSVPAGSTVAVAVLLGLGSSWIGTAGFNHASARLPRHVVAPLMALEPAWTLVFAHVIDGRLPTPLQAAGEALLVAGAAVALRSLRSRPATAPAGRLATTGPHRSAEREHVGSVRLEPDPSRRVA